MFGFSMGEILLISLIALLLFGNEKLPQNIRKFMKGWSESKSMIFGLQKSWHEIKFNLKEDLENLDKTKDVSLEKAKNLEPIPAQPLYAIVSQEEIDLHQKEMLTENFKIEKELDKNVGIV